MKNWLFGTVSLQRRPANSPGEPQCASHRKNNQTNQHIANQPVQAELELVVGQQVAHILAVTESWLHIHDVKDAAMLSG